VTTVPVLDHGYVEFVESWGSDERIIEAARMSTGKGFQGWSRACDCPPEVELGSEPCPKCSGRGRIDGDERLLAYLWNNKHATPFEMAGMTIEVQAPIFVFREWHRHRTQSYNEMSARYTPLPDLNYVPTVERLMIGAGTGNKQAGTISTAAILTPGVAHGFRERLAAQYVEAESLYQIALGAGVPKELARLCIPVARYSRMRASANLRNWLAFLTLRMASNAQFEIQQYADVVGSIIATNFPRTWELFVKGGEDK
jgi:thymidylate synthase (FAD)